MADVPVPSLTRARELKIEELSKYFANDDLSLDELEHRIELVYKAGSVADLEKITADLRGAATVPADYVEAKVVKGKAGLPATYEVPQQRLLALMSSTRRVGRWAVPRELDLVAIMSDTKIDLTHAVLSAAETVIDIRATMASLRIIVPPGMRVITDTSSIMSNVHSRADALEETPAAANAPVVRLTGWAFMSDVKIIVRRLEETAWTREDDDDDEE